MDNLTEGDLRQPLGNGGMVESGRPFRFREVPYRLRRISIPVCSSASLCAVPKLDGCDVLLGVFFVQRGVLASISTLSTMNVQSEVCVFFVYRYFLMCPV